MADDGNNTIRRVDVQEGAEHGRVTTLAGTAGMAGMVDGSRSAARFTHPVNVAHDGDRYLYVAQWSEIPMGTGFGYAGTLRQVDTRPGVDFGSVVTVAGDPAVSDLVDGPATTARFANPRGLAHDHDHTLYISDVDTIRRVDTQPGATFGTVSAVAGSVHAAASVSADGRGTDALFVVPMGITLDARGWLYVADIQDATVRRVDVRTGDAFGTVTTVVGAAGLKGDLELGPLSAARLNSPLGVAWLGSGSLLIVDVYVHAILRADGL